MRRILFLTLCLLVTGTVCTMAQGTSPRGSKAMLETPYFYFDNPDGTIEAFPEYRYRALSARMMTISSTKYANPLKGEPEGVLKQYENLVNLFFARQTRTTVFVFDGQESAKATMMMATIYSSTVLGLWASMDEAMRDQVKEALDKANIKSAATRSAKDGITMGKPEELMFNGHEGGHIVNRMDMSNSWLSLFAGANIDIVSDMYFYYDQEFDKMVAVVFSYSETNEPTGHNAGIVKAIGNAIGMSSPNGENTLATMFERHDMIDFFKQHFHLKKTPKTPAEFIGTATEPKLSIGDDVVTIDIQEIFDTTTDQSKDTSEDKEQQPGDKSKQPGDKTKQPGDKSKQPGDKNKQPGDKSKQPGDKSKQPGENQQQTGEDPQHSGGGGNNPQPGDDPEPPIIGDPIPPIIDPEPPIIGDPIPPIKDPEPPVKDPDPQPIKKPGPTTGAPRSAKKFAVIGQGFNYESIDHPFVENDQFVYFMQPQYTDNAVLAVNKQTGELTEAVPGKRKADRPAIVSIGAHGSDLYLDVEGRGIVRYDGKDVTTSELIGEVDRGFMDNYKKIVVSPNGRYLAYGGQNCHGYVYDLQDGNKLVKSFHDGFEDFLVTDDGDFFGVNNYRALVYRNNGNSDGDANSTIDMSDLLKDHPATICQLADDVCLAGGSKVTKTAAKEFQWTETTSLTGGVKLQDAALAHDGSGFAYIGRDDAGNRFASFTTTNHTPTLLKKLATGLNVERREPLTVEVAKNIFIDSNQNIWMVENTGTCLVVVYNPQGIVGLSGLAGKFVKQKK